MDEAKDNETRRDESQVTIEQLPTPSDHDEPTHLPNDVMSGSPPTYAEAAISQLRLG